MNDKHQHVVIFKSEDGKVSVDARFTEEELDFIINYSHQVSHGRCVGGWRVKLW